jgi:hypothetical protein
LRPALATTHDRHPLSHVAHREPNAHRARARADVVACAAAEG